MSNKIRKIAKAILVNQKTLDQ